MRPLPINHPKSPAGASGKSPTERTLGLLRELGFACGIVERRIPYRRNLTADLFGIIDIIALTREGVLGVQSTGTNFAVHLKKLTRDKAVDSARWLRTPSAALMLIGWRKIRKQRGRSQTIWAPRIKMITTIDLVPALTEQNRLDLARPFAPTHQGHLLGRYSEYLE